MENEITFYIEQKIKMGYNVFWNKKELANTKYKTIDDYVNYEIIKKGIDFTEYKDKVIDVIEYEDPNCFDALDVIHTYNTTLHFKKELNETL